MRITSVNLGFIPVFRINILFAKGKRFKEYHLIDGVELDTYYKRLARLSQRAQVSVVSFYVVQVSEYSREATFMRENKITRMSRHVPNMKPKPMRVIRRRRL